MFTARFTIALAVAACAAAVWASAADAGAWMVGGTVLTGHSAIDNQDGVSATPELNALGITVKCTAAVVDLATAEIVAQNTGAAASAEFSGCGVGVEGAETCSIGSKEIHTLPLAAEATLQGVSSGLGVIKAKSGPVLATIQYEGTECALKGKQEVTGNVFVDVPNGQLEKSLQQVEVEPTHSTVKVGVNNATLTGAVSLQLANGRMWSFL